MATVYVTFVNELENETPLLLGSDVEGETMTAIVSSAENQTTDASPITERHVARVTSLGGDVIISFGTAPNATSDTLRFAVPDDHVLDFYVEGSSKCAVVNA